MKIKLTFTDGSVEIITIAKDFALHDVTTHTYLPFITNDNIQYFFDTDGDVTLRVPSKVT